VNILAGSFNVNGKEPKEALDHWLLRQNKTPDIIVVGIQEIGKKFTFIFFLVFYFFGKSDQLVAP
jgi:hypothetical protein